MNKKTTFDSLKILTKSQIIDFLKEEYFLKAPEERRVKFYLWMVKSEEHQSKTKKYLEDKTQSILACKLDENARLINAEKNINAKLELMRKREKLSIAFQRELCKWEKLDKEYQKIEKLIE